VSLLSETAPSYAVGVRLRVGRLLREAASLSSLPVKAVESVKVPKDLWQERFVRRLRGMVASLPPTFTLGHEVPGPSTDRRVSMSAVTDLFRRNGNRRMRVYQIAALLAPSGTAHDRQALQAQVRRLLKQHRSEFDCNGAGIRIGALTDPA
jgi:hypothetical protein